MISSVFGRFFRGVLNTRFHHEAFVAASINTTAEWICSNSELCSKNIEKSLCCRGKEFSAVRLQQTHFLDLVEEPKTLQQNMKKQKGIIFLKNHVAELEQCTHIDYIIVCWLKIKPQSYVGKRQWGLEEGNDKVCTAAGESLSAF